MYEYDAEIVNVVDGDTFDLDIDVGFHIHVHERVRLLGIDTPEKRGDKEKAAGLAVTEWAQHFVGEKVRIKSYKGTDSFGRWLVELRFLRNGRDIRNLYDRLGINKLRENYKEEYCFELTHKFWEYGE